MRIAHGAPCLLLVCSLVSLPAEGQVSAGGAGSTRGAGTQPAGGPSPRPESPEPGPDCDGGGFDEIPAPSPKALAPGRCRPRPFVAFAEPVMAETRSVPLPAGVAPASWQLWWRHNRDAFLDLRRRLDERVLTGSDTFFLGHGDTSLSRDLRRPSREEISTRVVPALSAALESERDPQILQRSMIALAKIGPTQEGGLVRALHERIDHPNQSVAETAVLSLGILGEESAVPTLVALLEDTRAGWQLADQVSVSTRTRAFAAYALGLIGARSDDVDFKREIVARLVRILEQPHFPSRDLKVAAITAIGLTPLPVDYATAETADEKDHAFRGRVTSRQDQLRFLRHYFAPEHLRANASTRHWLVRAHAPTAMARLCEGAPEHLREQVAEQLIAGFGPRSPEHREVQQTCILALGQLGDADGDQPLDVRIRAELTRAIEDADELGKRFALIALARTGARRGQGAQPWSGLAETERTLLALLERGGNQLRPWVALALGVQGHALARQGHAVPERSREALQEACADNRRPDECGAFMIALGMQRNSTSSEVLLDKLELFTGSDGARGDAAVALGMMDERRATDAVQELVQRSVHRPELLSRAAIGLGLLGDRRLVPRLVDHLSAASSAQVSGSIASALGFIGDARSIDPLVGVFENPRAKTRARAWAAVALGRVCDREPLPWSSILAADLNYMAAPATLTEPISGSGVLDLF